MAGSELTIREKEKTDAISRIQRFMSNQESGVVLTGEEEKILSRLIYANALLSERKYNQEAIIERIREKFSVSPWTARNDIDNTYSLFSSVTEDYKRYTLKHHIEDIEKKIRQWENDKSMAHLLPKLYEARTRAIVAMPVKLERPDLPPPVIVLNLTGNIIQSGLTADQARAQADELLKFEDKEITDIDHEEVKNE